MSHLTRTSRLLLPLLSAALLSGGPLARSASALAPQQVPGELRLRLVPPGQAKVDLSKLSFREVTALVTAVQPGGELVLPLPVAGRSAFAPIEIARCAVALDSAQKSLVVAGEASVRGRSSRVFLSGTFPASGPGQYAFGISPDSLELAEWYPALKGTPLAGMRFQKAGLVVASAAHTLPPSALVAEILGEPASAGSAIEVQAGVGLRATLDAQTLPAARQLFARLGIERSQLRLRGRLGSDADLLSGEGPPKPVEVELRAELEAAAINGLRSRLPSWVRPTSVAPSLDLAYSSATGLVLAAAFDATVEVAGESRAFRLSSQLDADGAAGALTLRGETVGAWQRPLGIDWLSLPGASLVVTGDGNQARAELFSTLRIGAKEARLDVRVDGQSARLEARLDSLTIGDLAAFVSERTGSSFVKDLQLGDAARLADVTLTLARAKQKNELELAATAGLGGAKADVLLTLSGAGKGKVEPLFAIRRRAAHLSDLVPALRGKPMDLALPESVWTLTPPKRGTTLPKLSSADLGPAARSFFSGVYGSGDFSIELQPGIHFGAVLPVAKLPPALVQAVGIQDTTSSLILEGQLAMSLDLVQGRPSAAIDSLEVQAELPRVAGASTHLPSGLPPWMRPNSSAQRTLTLRYAAPSSVTFLRANDILADLDGQTRHFRIATEIGADAKQGSVALSGRMVGEWRQPFGLRALNLRDVTLTTGARAETGKGGAHSGRVVLEGGFDLGPKSGRMQLEIAAGSGKGVAGTFTGTLDSLSLDELPKLDLFPNLPKEGLQRLGSALGSLPPLENPTLHIALGGGQPSITLTAGSNLRGARSQLLAFVGKGPRGPQAVIGIRPEGFSLAKLLPKLGENPAVAPLANLSLERFGLFAVLGEQALVASEVDPQVREFFAAVTGEEDFELKLSAGLNIEASFPPERLPQEMGQALARLNQSLGLDKPGNLSLRGTLAANPSEMRLAAALPPLRPARAPKWLKSGQLAIVLTGTPSMALGATLVVDCDGDILNLVVEGGVERQGANVAIALKGALQADEVWTSPFGMEWLEIRRFSAQLSIDALANVGFGGGGDVTIGSKDIKVFAWTKINAATGVPMGLVVNGASEVGVALSDLAQLQAKMRAAAKAGGPKLLPLQLLPDVALRDFEILIASRAVPEEGIDSPGFRLTGDLYLPLKPGASATKLLSVDCGVSQEGILAKGYLGAYKIGPLTWEDSYVDLEATLKSQHLLAHGKIQFLGSSSETDLRFTREALSFETTREIQGLGKSHLLVEAKFDLKSPSFHVLGQLDNEFGKKFGATAIGEVVDVGGKAAAIGQAAIQAVSKARGVVEGIRKEAELPTALEAIHAIAAQRVKDAQAAADAHKREMDAKYKAWQDTPTSEPVKRKARELAWGQSKFAYDQGPMSRIKVLERRKAQYAKVHAGVEALERAKAENQRVQAALGNFLGEIAAYKGKTVVVTSASIESSIEGLMALKDGLPVDMRLEVLFCGKPKTVNIPWIVGRPAQNAKTLVAALVPSVSQLING